MELAMMLPARPDKQWQLARQLGVRYAITKAAPELSGEALPPWDFATLRKVHRRFEEAGFELIGLEGDQFDMSRIKLGLPGREEDLEHYRAMLRNMGRLGIRLLCYNFMVGIGWFRTRFDAPERGGALSSEFSAAALPPEPVEPIITREAVWRNYETFLRAVLPAAEEAGVMMGLHPDDPPIPQLKGYGRIFIDAASFRRAMAFASSPNWRITFCQATFRMMGEDVEALIREFGSRIVFFHVRDAVGNAAQFRETFHDNGPTDMPRLFQILREAAPDCILRPDHTPAMAGEGHGMPGYETLGNLFAVGYIKGICDTLNIEY